MVRSSVSNIVKTALVTVVILTVPLLGNRFVEGWNWDMPDFVVAAILIFGTGLLFQLIFNKVSHRTYRIMLVVFTALIFIYVWAELAVGIFNIPGISGS